MLLSNVAHGGLRIRDYVAVNEGRIYWFRLEASASRWKAVEPRLDAVAQTFAMPGYPGVYASTP